MERSRTSAASSYDGQAQAEVNLAAALYDSHRFQEMEDLLDPWYERLDADPLIVTPMTRVMVFNTLARAESSRAERGGKRCSADPRRSSAHGISPTCRGPGVI